MVRAYFNEQADTWDKTSSERDTSRLKLMARHLDIRPAFVVLDVGTGTGVFLPFLLHKVGQDGRIVALDFAEKMLRKAQTKGFKGNIDYLQADVTSIPLCSGIFDIIVCYSSFPHFQDKPKALTEMNRVIKAGGRLVICHSSSRASINQLHHQIPAVKKDMLPGEEEMRSMLSAAGFLEIKIEDASESYLASARKA